jgi:predicted anti-sigma-YlaC factor YlaD
MSEHKPYECRSLLDSLSDYVDGTLDEGLCKTIESHVAECQNCRIVVDTLRKTISLYQKSAAVDEKLPEAVRGRLLHTLKLDDYIHH